MSEKEKFELRISGDECEKIGRVLRQEYDKDNSKCILSAIKAIKKFLGRHFFTIFALIIICKYFCFALRYTHPIFLYYFKNVIPALVASIGVFEGFKYNRRQAYKEIVTRERINWLHKMQDNLALYLELTSYHDKKGKKSRQEKPDKVKSARDKDYKSPERLYHEILFNINHNKDAKAKIALENYHRAYEENWEGFQVGQDYQYIYIELEVCPEDEDKKTFIIKDTKELSKKIRENTPKSMEELRKEVEEEFTEIFKEVWTRVKKEAD